MVTADDLAALEWIKENNPEDARFFINTAYWQNNTYRGVDGGGWLLPYTGRWSVVPTVFYGFSPDKKLVRQTRDWGEEAFNLSACSSAFWTLIKETDVDWIYLREGAGSLQPQALSECAGIYERYANHLVRIYQIIPD
jgi:hypothetical protein